MNDLNVKRALLPHCRVYHASDRIQFHFNIEAKRGRETLWYPPISRESPQKQDQPPACQNPAPPPTDTVPLKCSHVQNTAESNPISAAVPIASAPVPKAGQEPSAPECSVDANNQDIGAPNKRHPQNTAADFEATHSRRGTGVHMLQLNPSEGPKYWNSASRLPSPTAEDAGQVSRRRVFCIYLTNRATASRTPLRTTNSLNR